MLLALHIKYFEKISKPIITVQNFKLYNIGKLGVCLCLYCAIFFSFEPFHGLLLLTCAE